MSRIKQALKAGFRHLVFEDNYDTGTGDHYSLRQICDQSYIQGACSPFYFHLFTYVGHLYCMCLLYHDMHIALALTKLKESRSFFILKTLDEVVILNAILMPN